MRETWLKPNRRALAVAMLGPAALAVLGMGLLVAAAATSVWGYAVVGGAMVLGGAVGVVFCAWAMSVPRLAYEDGHLLVFASSARPYRVPIEVVEVFFLGHGPVVPSAHPGPTTRNVVVRLAEAAADWQQREIRRELGQWCGGYIVLRGTWCEPLSLEQLNALNHRLAEVRRQRRQVDASAN